MKSKPILIKPFPLKYILQSYLHNYSEIIKIILLYCILLGVTATFHKRNIWRYLIGKVYGFVKSLHLIVNIT